MKKIILILFLFLLCFACYYIYNSTQKKENTLLCIGDIIANNPYLKKCNTEFINNDMRIIDLVNIINYNEEVKQISIHQLFKDSDIIILSIGMNDIYYKFNTDTKELYTYLNNMINNYDKILAIITRYDPKNVIILGYYNIFNKYNDIFTYVNYKLSKLASSYNYTYVELNEYLGNKQDYYQNSNNFYLNYRGYYKIYNILVEKTKKY